MARLDIGGLEVRDRVGLPRVLERIVGCFLALPGADPALVARLTLSPKRVGAVHGRCRYPKPLKGRGPGPELRRQGYVVTAAVRTDPAAYPLGFAHWGALRAPRTKQGWRSGPVLYGFGDVAAAAGFVVAHELAHIALRQKWVPVKNTEAVTNALALLWCAEVGLRVDSRPADRWSRLVPPAEVLRRPGTGQLSFW